MQEIDTPTTPQPRWSPASDSGSIDNIPPGGKIVAAGFEDEPNPRIPREGGAQ